MKLHTTVDAQVVLLGTADELGTARTRPSIACCIAYGRSCIDIDAARLLVVFMTKEVSLVGGDGEDGQLCQTLYDFGAQRGVVTHLGVHLVIGFGRTTDLRVLSPG